MRISGPVKVWEFDDTTIPKAIKDRAYRGGDEDLIIVGKAGIAETDRENNGITWVFRHVAERLDTNGWNINNLTRYKPSRGGELLIYVVCHA